MNELHWIVRDVERLIERHSFITPSPDALDDDEREAEETSNDVWLRARLGEVKDNLLEYLAHKLRTKRFGDYKGHCLGKVRIRSPCEYTQPPPPAPHATPPSC